MRQVSVVIPSYNSFLTISKTLGSLTAQERPELLREILVVDSSDDGRTPALLEKERHEKVKVIRLQQKTMPATGRNIGAEAAAGDILAFIDSDAYAAPDWLKNIAGAVEAGCRVGGGAVLLPDFQRDKKIAVAQYFLQFNAFAGGSVRRVVSFTPSCNLFCEKKTFERIGGFPKMRASEDVVFGRLASAQEKFYFDPSIRVYHIFREEAESYFQNQRLLGRYILIYRRDVLKSAWCRGWLPLLLAAPLVLVKWAGISYRVLKYGGLPAFGRYLGAHRLFLAGLWFWGVGFAGGWSQKNEMA